MAVPELRIRVLRDQPPAEDRRFVLYWMTATRRLHDNYALERAVEWCQELGLPLFVLEALRLDYPWASDRLHTFIVQGMADNHGSFGGKPARYYPYVERGRGEGKGLLAACAAEAAVVVTDDFPAFFLPHMLDAAARKLRVRLEAVDSNGLIPLRAFDRVFARAFDFRRAAHRVLVEHLAASPKRDPFRGARIEPHAVLPQTISSRWPEVRASELGAVPKLVSSLPLDHSVRAAVATGGSSAAEAHLSSFLKERVGDYAERDHPDDPGHSNLSPYLHFGHVSSHRVLARLSDHCGWVPRANARGKNAGALDLSGLPEGPERFLDQVLTWRELGYNMASRLDAYDRYESLPDWARKTLREHTRDPREHLYSLEDLEEARTGDELWNAAQRQLVREGTIHRYLRMLWGKKVILWTERPEDALSILVELNNKYATDGRDPNSYSGIFWCFGRYDRPWGPKRPILGTVRYMSSDSTRRKLRVDRYIERHRA